MISSESSYKNRKHAVGYVIGLCGINLKANKNLPFNPYTDYGNMQCGAYLLASYLKVYGTYPKALKRYKGWCKLGECQANDILRKI